MLTTLIRIGIVGRGAAATSFVERLRAAEGVALVGCADVDQVATSALASLASGPGPAAPVPAFADHAELIREARPHALAIFTPSHAHYRPAMDGLQAGCHLLIEGPLSTIAQEAVDIVGVARGRGLKVGVRHRLRHMPTLIAARDLVRSGAIGRVRLIEASISGGPASAGIELIDALLWASGSSAASVAAFQLPVDPGQDAVTSAVLRLADGTLATIAVAGPGGPNAFSLVFDGERGQIRATDSSLALETDPGESRLLAVGNGPEDVDANFVAALRSGTPLGCPAEQAVATVRVLEAIARSAATGQFVGLG